MRKFTCAACFFAAFASASCSTAPVDSVVYRAWCETEECWISRHWHLTDAEAEAHVALHRCEHPEHAVTYISTPGPVPAEVSDAPLSPEFRSLLLLRDR